MSLREFFIIINPSHRRFLFHSYYVKYLDLFTAEVAANGAGVTLNKYLLGPEANGNGSDMFARFLAGV